MRSVSLVRLVALRPATTAFRSLTAAPTSRALLTSTLAVSPVPARFFTASTSNLTKRDATREVANFLDRELEEANGTIDDRDLTQLLEKDGWQMSSEHGKVTLLRTQGSEMIRVEIKAHFVPLAAAPAEENSEEASGETPEIELLPGMEEQEDYFTVIVKKRNIGSELVFECCANRGFIEIDQIVWKGSGGEPHLVKISEIEEEGQEAFYDYLEERGVDNNFTKAIFLALDVYDQNEFRAWLRGIKEFVRS